MKKITLLAALFAIFTTNAQDVIWEDGFEDDFDFEIVAITGWTQIDLDASATYGSTDYDFTNEGYTGTAIVFNPSQTTPDASGDAEWQVRTGDKGLWMFAATSLLNDDYIITPQIDLTASTGSSFTFYAKSITDAFGLERFEVLLSTTGTDAADFTEDIGGGELQAPTCADCNTHTEYTFDISAYDGEQIYIAIHYVAQDSFILQMDDFSVEGTLLGIESNNIQELAHAVTANELTLRAGVAMENVSVFNVLGQEVISQRLNSNNESINISALNSGVYIVRVSAEGQSKSFKIVKR